jgi:primosomal protein N''
MAQATFDQVLEQARTLSADEQLRLIAYLAERLRTQVPATPETSPAATEKVTITERLARANYRGGALFETAEEVDAYIRAERDSWEG